MGAVGDRLVLRFPIGPDERLYGLGLQFRSLDQRGTVRRLRVDHYGSQDTGATHAPCPVYVSSRGYGVFVNSARYMTVYAGTALRKDSLHPPVDRDRSTDPNWTASPLSDAVEIGVPGDAVEVFLFGGPTPLAAVQRFNLLCGGGCLPPRWGLGFWHRVPMAFSDREVVAEVAAFRERGFPLDVIGLEPGWQSRAYPCTYEWDCGRFPDPEGFCRSLADSGVRVNLWENPYVSPRSPLHAKLAELSGSHTVWCGLVPDYSLPQAREVLTEQHDREHLARGVSGYKLDEVDGIDAWLWPDHATFPSGHSGEVMRQTYGLQMQKLIVEMFRRRNRRTYGLVRGTNAGASAYPFVIYSDCYSHRDFITALCTSGFGGVLWTPEARSAASAEEWLRRIQTTCFSPLAMINAWADGTKPWSFPEVEAAVREAIVLRKRLVPYLYSAFARYHFEGVPPFRAMALEAGWDGGPGTPARGELDATENPYAVAAPRELTDQYMMGDSLLVAPLFAGEAERGVWLPPGAWCDFYTGEGVEGGRDIRVADENQRIPVFVRDGGIVPLIAEDAAGEEALPLEVRHYGHSEGRFLLYDDDGETYDYEQGAFRRTELTVLRDADGLLRGDSRVTREGPASGYGELRWRFMTP